MFMNMKSIFVVIAFVLSSSAIAQSMGESQTERYFESIKSKPQKLAAFLAEMPKGGDLHNHASGATYAENMLRYAYADNLCVNRSTFTVFAKSNCHPDNLLNKAIQDVTFNDALIDAWSMRRFHTNAESGHNHFFATFEKFGLIADKHSGEVLSEIVQRAGIQNEQYLELMVVADGNESGKLGKKLGFNPDFAVMRNKLLNAGFKKIINDISHSLDQDESIMHSLLACDTNQLQAGCGVKVRYLYEVLREQAPEMVFAQLLAGFEAASHDKRVVGVNMVQPEDGRISMRDYELHMQMVGFLHQQYPQVHISLHAGELTSELVAKEGLTFHIDHAVNVAHAERIGHGVDIQYENNADILLQEMAARQILVEINLTSNAVILNVEGTKHPFPLYMQYDVPVALATDDEGVNRSNLTKEFQRAVTTFQFSYPTLKTLVRNSMTYAFLPGKSLWINKHVVSACDKDRLGSANPSQRCQAFIHTSEKASEQWELEKRFAEFESKISERLLF